MPTMKAFSLLKRWFLELEEAFRDVTGLTEIHNDMENHLQQIRAVSSEFRSLHEELRRLRHSIDPTLTHAGRFETPVMPVFIGGRHPSYDTATDSGLMLSDQGHGVYLADPVKRQGANVERIGDITLHRFMDYIYVDRPLIDVDGAALSTVNLLRQAVAKSAPDRADACMGEPNLLIKHLFGELAKYSRSSTVLEWGCGYQPMIPYLPSSVRYTGVDVDPKVVEVLGANTSSDADVVHMESFCDTADRRRFDLILGVFVSHHKVEQRHLDALAKSLGTDGVFVTNVYRRTPNQRRDLEQAFWKAGMAVIKVPDRFQVATGHDIWFAYPHYHPDRAVLLADLYDIIQCEWGLRWLGRGDRRFNLDKRDPGWAARLDEGMHPVSFRRLDYDRSYYGVDKFPLSDGGSPSDKLTDPDVTLPDL